MIEMEVLKPNHCTQAAPVRGFRELLALVSGAPGADRYAL